MYKGKPVTMHMSFLLKPALIVLILTNSTCLLCQVPGCKDPMANNYNVAATINDGSCMYNPVSYTPPVKTDPINAILNESSGLQMADNFLWTFNDGGGAPAIYRIDTLSSNILQTVNLGGATNVDWEDIAFDGTNFYVGDFGNNDSGSRTDLKIYKFPLSVIPDYTTNATVTIPPGQVEAINFTYSDQGTPQHTTSNNTKYDCEAMIVDNGQIHLFTKNWLAPYTVHYVINGLSAGAYVAAPVDTLNTNYLVTAADKAPGNNIIALLGYKAEPPFDHFMHLLSDYSNGHYFNGNKRRIDLGNVNVMGQAEGLAFRNNTYGYIGNERVTAFSVTQKLRAFNINNFVPLYVLPLQLKNFTVNTVNGNNQITWAFYNNVENLQLEYSTDGLHFSVLKVYKFSVGEVVYNNVVNPVNFYRISWHENNGDVQYSNVIRIKNDVPNTIRSISLNMNGEISFFFNGNAPSSYSFKLTGSDGKVLGTTKQQVYLPGFNRIVISKKQILDKFVYLTTYSSAPARTIFLRTEK